MTAARPRILMLTPAVPSDTGYGLAMRLGLFLEGLAQVGEVDLAVVPVSGPIKAPRRFVKSTGARERTLAAPQVPETQFALLSKVADPAAQLRAFRQYGRPSLAARVTPALKAEIADVSGGYDLIHVGRLYLAEATAGVTGAILSLDLDEDDPDSFRSRAREATDPADAAWLDAEADAFDMLMAQVAPRFRHLTIASGDAAASVAARHPNLAPLVVPNAVRAAGARRRAAQAANLIFVGSLQYGPNREGLAWFTDTVWPLILRHEPRARLVIVGRNPPPELAGRRGISTPGYVKHLAPVYARTAAAIAPMRSGGGTRIKILEAAAHGLPTIATPQSLAGLDLGPDAGWCADTPEAFAAACLEALGARDESLRRGKAALEAVAARYDRIRVAAALAESVRELFRHKDGGQYMADEIRDGDVFVQVTGVDATEVPDGYVVYEANGTQVHYLNPTAVLVYEFCDGRRDAGAIAAMLAKAYELPEPPLEDVKRCLSSLIENRLIRQTVS